VQTVAETIVHSETIARRPGRYAVLCCAVLAGLLASPLAAQEVQGPPDGFREAGPPPAQGSAPAQGPDDGGIPPLATPRPQPRQQPQPQPRQQPPAPTITSVPGLVQPAPPRAAPLPPAPPSSRARADLAAPSVSRTAPSEPVEPASPPDTAAVPLPAPDGGSPPATDAVPAAPSGAAGDIDANRLLPTWWPWTLALFAAFVAGLWWFRRNRRDADLNDGDTEARTPSEAPAAPPPPASPPTPAVPARPPMPTPAAAPLAPHAKVAAEPVPLPPPPAPVLGRANLAMTLQVNGIEMLADQARISFSLQLANTGDRAATGGLVRIALQQANRDQAELLTRFFDGAGGSVLAEDVEIAAGDVGSIQRHALLSLDQVEPMLVGGYPSLIPVMGFDVSYHWDGDGESFGQIASAFVLGSAAGADGRIAPVRLDQGPRRLPFPAARVTEMHRML